MKTAVDEISIDAYTAILKSMGFRQHGNKWVKPLDRSSHNADEFTVMFEDNGMNLEVGGEQMFFKFQGMYPQKLRREINEMTFVIKASTTVSRIASKIAYEAIAINVGGFGRSFYIPSNITPEVIKPDGTDIEAYFYEQLGKYYGVAFAGKSNKPIWNYRFSTRAGFDSKLNSLIQSRASHSEEKQKRRLERSEFKHDLQVGDILYSSWGYDQTNIDYYQVVGTGNRSVKIRKIDSKSVDDSHVMPMPNKFIGPVMTKMVLPRNNIKINSFAYAHKWTTGQKNYVTPAWMGH